jgi:hypothetical protein
MAPNPPPPFDADDAERLITETGEWIDAWSADTWIVDLRDNLRAAVAEVDRMTECLKRANANHEHFERLWYLEKDQNDRLRKWVKELEQAGERVAGDDTASLNAGLSLPNLQVTRDLRDSRDMT